VHDAAVETDAAQVRVGVQRSGGRGEARAIRLPLNHQEADSKPLKPTIVEKPTK
jgi:hypothetical protein